MSDTLISSSAAINVCGTVWDWRLQWTGTCRAARQVRYTVSPWEVTPSGLLLLVAKWGQEQARLTYVVRIECESLHHSRSKQRQGTSLSRSLPLSSSLSPSLSPSLSLSVCFFVIEMVVNECRLLERCDPLFHQSCLTLSVFFWQGIIVTLT